MDLGGLAAALGDDRGGDPLALGRPAAIIVACSLPEPEPSVVTSCEFASPDLPWMSALSDWNPLYNCAFVDRMSPRCFANALSTWPPISGERYWPFHVSRSAFDGSFPLSISWRPYGAASGRSARPTTRKERIASAMRRSARSRKAKFSDEEELGAP